MSTWLIVGFVLLYAVGAWLAWLWLLFGGWYAPWPRFGRALLWPGLLGYAVWRRVWRMDLR